MSFKPEVEVQGSWSRNGLVFATREEAEANAKDLMSRWLLVDNCRAVEVDEKPNYRWVNGQLEEIKESEQPT